MYGSGNNQANTLGRGAPEVACGEDIRPEVILAASMKQEPTVSAVSTASRNPLPSGRGGRQKCMLVAYSLFRQEFDAAINY
jgi:hypothetical protein